MNEVTIFNNEEFGQIRGFIGTDGQPWFVGKDVAQALGYANTKDAISTHVDEDDKRIIQRSENATFDIPNRGLTIINESGVYSLIIGSKLPSAKKFKRWVTSEVLPTIRKTGTYSIQKKETLQGKELLALAVIEAQKVIEEQTMQIEEMKPKADYHDEVLNKKKLISTTIIAKDLGFTSAIMLNRYLHDKGIIYKSQSGIWCPYAKYEWLIEEGYADYQSCNIEGSLPTLKWTEKGRKWIVELLQKRAVL